MLFDLTPAGAGMQSLDPDGKNLQDGEYVGMRRFTRTLERGAEAKAEVDSVVDACGVLINLRTSIMRYRKPKSVGKFFRPEIQARHSAFQRGSAYLERYCMLVTFAAYLSQCRHRGRRMTFAAWVAARPDILAAREALHQNPAGALAPVPHVPLPLAQTPHNHTTAAVPPPYNHYQQQQGGGGTTEQQRSTTPIAAPFTAGRNVSIDEQRRVLLRRKGSTVGRRSILKSMTMAGHPSRTTTLTTSTASPYIQGVTDFRKATSLPVYTVGNAVVEGLRQLLTSMGAGAHGPTHLVITDLREELVLYVNGTAYLRRELEMPAAALHHAGIQAAKLEDLERRLRGDMMSEAAMWGGRVLLHREVDTGVGVGGSHGGGGTGGTDDEKRQQAISTEMKTMMMTTITTTKATMDKNKKETGSTVLHDQKQQQQQQGEDITRTTEYQPTTQVAAFWEEVTGGAGDIDSGMCTPAEVFIGLAAEGYQISYRRVPLSRERTPQAVDLNHLHHQMTNYPGDKQPAYLFISRTAMGSSARFASAFACTVQRAIAGVDSFGGGGGGGSGGGLQAGGGSGAMLYNLTHGAAGSTGTGDSPHRFSMLHTTTTTAAAATEGTSPMAKRPRSSTASLLRNDSELSDLVRSAQAGEYRGVMNLCRVLPGGAEAKAAVDEAIDACQGIGNLRDDILKCKEASEEENLEDPSAMAAARRLGLHYLQRYFFLIAFRVFLESVSGGLGGLVAPVAFSEWVAQRREITYLLSNLELE